MYMIACFLCWISLSHFSETSDIRKPGLIETLGSYPTEHFLLPGSGWTMGRGIVWSSLPPHPIISSACPFQLLGIGGGTREERANVFVLNDMAGVQMLSLSGGPCLRYKVFMWFFQSFRISCHQRSPLLSFLLPRSWWSAFLSVTDNKAQIWLPFKMSYWPKENSFNLGMTNSDYRSFNFWPFLVQLQWPQPSFLLLHLVWGTDD